MADFGKVVVLLGGRSAEREVSLNSGARVLAALQRAGVDAQAFDPAERKLDELAAFDRAFIALHGRYGEDGTIQGVLELMGIPYTGSGVMASAVGMDKWRTKLLWSSVGLAIPEFVMLDAGSNLQQVEQRLGFPLFVKPACEGSSIGVSMVHKPGELREAYAAAAKHDALVIAERGILGGEYTVAILGDEALPIIRIEPATEFYDYEAKYLRDDTHYRCPCGLPETRELELRVQAMEAFRILGCRGWGRVDFLMDHHGQAFFLEVNTSPGMTDHSLVPMAARAAGISYDDLVLRVLALAALG
ncbi:D-alanine--D-alanine ligase [Propionivibrio sp.]|uniref:D-alanine--D-alanine ligase n=1 Tax=Propionivibrio sp. TaxID=2212460 RepID=UPI0025E53400|nr:D-alanine--D-alanine ligase [Propionivibrio sp.]MBK7354562.1 D-alanine--D-alanine ligase [Propionivibrio sp.]MBK8401932.1 D-alanine--D-alanine ligase [Propionivibrio sp.]MBK8743746.1 D-alanine--D-alanine ligase [Propionivibrio sp.]MBK8895518.1 D-alanine--D-alanine ligase [Propionivibrio sp.]